MKNFIIIVRNGIEICDTMGVQANSKHEAMAKAYGAVKDGKQACYSFLVIDSIDNSTADDNGVVHYNGHWETYPKTGGIAKNNGTLSTDDEETMICDVNRYITYWLEWKITDEQLKNNLGINHDISSALEAFRMIMNDLNRRTDLTAAEKQDEKWRHYETLRNTLGFK